MKALIIVSMAFLSGGAFAAECASKMQEVKIEIPKTYLRGIMPDIVSGLIGFRPIEAVAPVSIIPVFKPAVRMEPDEAFGPGVRHNYKLVVKPTDVELGK